MEKPISRPDIATLPPGEYNKVLQQTFKYFNLKKVKIPDGRIGVVVGVDPRPIRGGADGNFLSIRVERQALPGRAPDENVFYMPDDLTLVSDTTTTS